MKFNLGLSRQYPWSMLASTYITQYIGVAFILSAAIAILRQQGVALDKLALLNLAVLPLMGKVFYAPLIDKFRLSLQGKYRSWLIIAQACMTGLLVIAGMLDFQQEFTGILITLAVYVFFMSIQDVAIDGLSCKLFDIETRKLASSVQFSGNLLGNIIGGGLILMFYPWLEWQGSLWLLAALTSIALVQIIAFKEPAEVLDYQHTRSSQFLWRDIKVFIKQQKHWFVIMALYPIGSTCGFALLNPLLVDHGWTLDEIGFVMKIYGSIIGLFSALLATPLISRIGRINALICVILIQAVALLLMVPLTFGFTGKLMVYSAITVHFIGFPALLVVSSTMFMDKAAHSVNKATLFTLQFSFASLLGFLYSSLSMMLAKHIGYSTIVSLGAMFTFGLAFFVYLILKRAAKKAPISTLNLALTD